MNIFLNIWFDYFLILIQFEPIPLGSKLKLFSVLRSRLLKSRNRLETSWRKIVLRGVDLYSLFPQYIWNSLIWDEFFNWRHHEALFILSHFFQAETISKPLSLQNWTSSLHFYPILMVLILQWYLASNFPKERRILCKNSKI